MAAISNSRELLESTLTSLDDWADITPASEPTPRFNAALAYVQGHNKSIIFGGNLINIGSGGADDATIEYVGPRP